MPKEWEAEQLEQVEGHCDEHGFTEPLQLRDLSKETLVKIAELWFAEHGIKPIKIVINDDEQQN